MTADEIRSNMHARRIDMGDGRYLIYYTFDVVGDLATEITENTEKDGEDGETR
jgi:hypothetical protein